MAPSDVNATSDYSGWPQTCISLLPTLSSLKNGLVDQNGSPMDKFNSSTWGINYTLCQQYCNITAIPPGTSIPFQELSQFLTTYLFPWLSLTAQLPYETGGFWTNIMSFCMAVGSPALAIYSLMVTNLNRYRVRRQVEKLKDDYDNVHKVCLPFWESLDHICYVLVESQQVPLRVSQEDGWLSSLLVAPGNRTWWKDTKDNLKRTRREATFSLWAQVSYAVLAWIFVIISSFQASLGLPLVALQMSSGSVWIWMLPVIFGSLLVGTQYSSNTVGNAIKKDEAIRVLQETDLGGSRYTSGTQRGIVAKSELTRTFNDTEINNGTFKPEPLPNDQILIGPWVDLRGDERLQGPLFNYARLFTWYRFSSTILSALGSTMDNIHHSRPVRSSNGAQPMYQDGRRPSAGEGFFSGDAIQVAQYSGLQQPPHGVPAAYATFKEMREDASTSIGGTMFVASLVALFVQWGTTGAAITIAYLTPVVGLGCRSGSYLLYGVLATTGWIELVLAMVFSHQGMLRYQDFCTRANRGQAQNGATASNANAGGRPRSWSFRIYAGLAVSFWCLGRATVIVNAVWLIISSLMEIIGVYDNCFCNANVINRGNNGWVLLFKGPPDLKAAAQAVWGGGVTLSIMVALLGCAVMLFGLKEKW